MKYKLSELIEYFSVPAFVFSVDARKILAGNSQVFREYGNGFMKDGKIQIEVPDELEEKEHYLKIVQNSPVVTLEFCDESEADFIVVMFNRMLGIAMERVCCHWDQEMTKNGPKKPAPAASFHFNYIYNIATGKWTCSQPEVLAELGIGNLQEEKNEFDWRSVIVPEDRALYDNTFHNALKHGGNHEMHYRITTADGGTYAVADYCGVTAPENQWPVLVGCVVCSTRSEDAITQAERQVLTGRLLGGMIHDFKNLLGGIRNIIEWSMRISENQEVVDALNKTLGYTDQATELIIGTLRLNSPESESESRIEKINLVSLVYDLEGLISRIIPASTAFKIVTQDDIPDIYGQKSWLQDMILNLCVNARDAMKNKGDLLQISISPVIMSDERDCPQEYIALSVSDNGCGMSKAEVKQIFDAFYSTKSQGAGLGMWMVKNAVKAFDGKIEVESEVGQGSTFKILFPVVEPEVEFLETSEEATHSEAGPECDYSEIIQSDINKTILYVEDNVLISSSVRIWLESLGFKLLFAEDGLKGKELFEHNHNDIDLVIQDYVLPKINGDELLAYFVDKRPDIPVIVVSAENDAQCTKRLLASGASDMIRKPFKMDDLLKTLAKVLNI